MTAANERERLQEAIVTLTAQRHALGEAVAEAALAAIRQKLAELDRDAASRAHALYLSGERKLVTVVFADLSGFTQLGERLDPEALRSLVNACFSALVPIVTKYGGTIDKFIGDEIMALFGAPSAREDDAERALRATLEMMDALARFNARNGTDLGLHAGVNTGTVIAGGLGADGQQQYSVMGDAVNLASRLGDASETGQILVGARTYRLTAPLFAFRTLPPIAVKGKAGLVPVYELLGTRAIPESTRGIPGLHSPLVGRDAEIRQIGNTLSNLARGIGGLLALAGEPGVGKSRLVAESRAIPGLHVRWAESRAHSYTEGASYAVARVLLDSLLDIPPELPPSEVDIALRAKVDALFPDRSSAARTHLYLARLRALPLDADAEAELAQVLPEALQSRMRQAFVELVRALAAVQPLVLVWEDLHWADPSSFGLLEELLPLTEREPLLLLLVFRTHDGNAAAWYREVVAVRSNAGPIVELGPLTQGDSGRLVENLLKSQELPSAIRDQIVTKAEGNPFFLEELLRSLMETGVVSVDGGRIAITSANERLQVPDTLQGVVAARVDRLPTHEKQTLQTAAVIGRVFQYPVLENVQQSEGAMFPVADCVAHLERRELILHRLAAEYTFKHAVTREVTYESVLIAKRRALHGAVAHALEALFPDETKHLAAAIAYHCERAGIRDKAIHYFTLAADYDCETYSNIEAIEFYRAAIALADADEGCRIQAIELREKLGDVLALIGRHEDARGAFGEALAKAPAEDGVGRSRLHRKEGNTWMPGRDFQKSLQAFDAAEVALRAGYGPDDPDWQREWLEIQLDRLWSLYWANQVSEMATLLAAIQPVVLADGTPVQRAKYFRSAAYMAWRRDRFAGSEESLTAARAAVVAAEASGDRYEIGFARFGLGLAHLLCGEFDRAGEVLLQSLDLAERIGDAERQVLCWAYLATTSRRSHDIEATRRRAACAVNVAGAAKMPVYIGIAKANVAWAAWAEGKFDEAVREARSALDEYGLARHPIAALGLFPLAAIAIAAGRDAEATSYLRQLVAPEVLRLGDPIEGLVGKLIDATEAGDTKEARALLPMLVDCARRAAWL